METTKPQTPQAPAKAVKKAGKVAKVQEAIPAVNLTQSIRLTDLDLLLHLFPFLRPLFEAMPQMYRLEANHGAGSKRYLIWWIPHGTVGENYDTRSLKSYLADKAKGIGRIY